MERAMPDERQVWIGIDTGEKIYSACAIDAAGVALKQARFDATMDSLYAFLEYFKGRIALIGAEACSTSFTMARKLRTEGYPVALYNTRRIHRYIQLKGAKTDANDARGIAEVTRLGEHSIPSVHLKSAQCEDLRTLIVVRQHLIDQRLACEAVIRSTLGKYGGSWESGYVSSRNVRALVMDAVSATEQRANVSIVDLIEPLVDLAERLRRAAEKIDRETRAFANSHIVCSRFLKIPGIGPLTAISFFSAIDDPYRFHRTNDVGAYFGLVPKIYRSGEAERRGGITKAGNTLTRKHLRQAADAFLRTRAPSSLKDWSVQLIARIGKRRARIALARKLSVLMLALWKNDMDYDDCIRIARDHKHSPQLGTPPLSTDCNSNTKFRRLRPSVV
jgi:transposase